ncbi:MAG: hypothetical protein V7750_12545 [Sneathiella sp.]
MSFISTLKRAAAAFSILLLSSQIPALAAGKSMTDNLSAAKAETFMRTWLNMIDTNASPDEYLKFLPDGDFEQWSYPNAEIKDVAHLKAYFQQTWGMIKQNTNKVQNLDVDTLENGRFKIVTNVAWTAITAAKKTLASNLQYIVTVGSGTSAADPKGEYPKIFRYKITPQK